MIAAGFAAATDVFGLTPRPDVVIADARVFAVRSALHVGSAAAGSAAHCD